MKIVQVIFAIFLTLSLSSCDKDKEDMNNEISLSQTQWTRTLEETDVWGDGKYTANIGMIFYSENTGRCSVKKGDTSPFQYDFEYVIEDRILTIKEKKGDLDGHWLFIQSDKNKIILEKGTGGDGAYKGTLTLIRNY